MVFYIIILIVGAALLAWMLYVKSYKESVRTVFIKTGVSSCFMLTAVVCTSIRASSGAGYSLFQYFVVPGLLFGLLGDVWLGLKNSQGKEQGSFTLAGFISFLIGHLFYIVGMSFCYGSGNPLYIIVPILVGICLGFIMGFGEKLMKVRFGNYRTIVIIYGCALASMTLLALSLAIKTGWTVKTLNLMFIGGVLFLTSDLILCQMYFGKADEKSVVFTAANLITYYAAMFIIASSLMFA
ncbi:MAG: lysoplasmalogenase [Lachnospiraceae bacterium]|nr:lysoplasmalogenase [Lachnospiraceae bacterium]